MIVIQSESTDRSTDEVIRWLHYLEPGVEILRIDDRAVLSSITQRLSNSVDDFSFGILEHALSKEDISFFWYRRGYFAIGEKWSDAGILPALSTKASVFFRAEMGCMEKRLYESLDAIASPVNRYEETALNKLTVLAEARSLGLKIPDTLVTNDFEELRKFCGLYDQVITKAIQHNHFIAQEADCTIGFALDTALVNIESLKRCQSQTHFAVSALFQQYIPKKIELRVFYLHGTLYPMAIFSQNRAETTIDYRGQNKEIPTRNIPYKLPAIIEEKLNALFQKLSLQSGSADLILTKDDDIVFLEINPVGQFQWLARNCNYPLEREIAQHILNHHKDVKRNNQPAN